MYAFKWLIMTVVHDLCAYILLRVFKAIYIPELQIPVVNFIFRESLKRKASDSETVSLKLLSF